MDTPHLQSSIKLNANGKLYINGFSSSYDDTYPQQLKGILNQRQFQKIMDELNSVIQSYWSCGLCHYFGWLCSVPTVGLSFLCPKLCQQQAEEMAVEKISEFNDIVLGEYGIQMRLVKKFLTSYIEIYSFDHSNQQIEISNLDISTFDQKSENLKEYREEI
ncbi:hypothetical protein PPERSA_02402 [Pseudocohnilembus persalinus]|uniref:Golgin subfamily A member 7/ERF4 domain-containing protein n=1 Tax=Pseudocohnilembus persalinus TaxID=266149 RepID=A0A0V0QBG3_PSEPJ|nr:hypothetical protein PPERSA_02402 [Pseudocohnilembus persalinus]|eukprot:KRW99544.1 hypothetical protein PPERSA_02402 [Pseudocohnilembus persalinus]